MRAGPLIGLIVAGLVIAALGIAGGGGAPADGDGSSPRVMPGTEFRRPRALPSANTN